MSKSRKYEVGQEIEAECTRCKADMVHVITSIKDDVIKKVMCKGCYTTHTFRGTISGEGDDGRPRSAPRRKSIRRRRVKDWATLVSDVDDSEVRDYEITKEYDVNQAIRHKQFGIGVITHVVDQNKIEVVFQDQTRILVQNWN